MVMSKKRRGITTLVVLGIILYIAVMIALVLVMKHFFDNGGGDDLGNGDGYADGNGGGNNIALPGERTENKHSVSSLDIDAVLGKVSSTVQISEDCTLLLRFIEERSFFESRELGGYRYIEGVEARCEALTVCDDIDSTHGDSNELLTLELNLPDGLPQSFVAEVLLVDSEDEPLCAPLYNAENTDRYRTFDALTAEDYAAQGNVVRLDADDNRQFGVLADDVKIITADSVSMYLGTEEGYRITSPSEEIKRGDKVLITDGKRSALLLVLSTKVNGDTVTVYPEDAAAGLYLRDFYKVMKVDMSFSDGETVGEVPVALSQSDSFDGGVAIGNEEFEFEPVDGITVKGGIGGGRLNLDGRFVWEPSIFGEDYFECEVDVSAKFKVSASVTAEAASAEDDDDNWTPIFDASIPTPVPGLSVGVSFLMYFSWKAVATASIEDVPVEANSGFRYSTLEGVRAKEGRSRIAVNDNDDWFSVSGEFNADFGPRAGVEIEFLHGLIYAGVTADAMLHFVCGFGDEGGNRLMHKCYFCVNGVLSFSCDVSVRAGVRVIEGLLEWEPVNVEVYHYYKFAVYDFYASLRTAESAVEFGRGYCQNFTVNATVNRFCEFEKHFVCNKLEKNGDVHFEQKESDEESRYHSGYGEHDHIAEAVRIEIVDLDSGKVLYSFETEVGNDEYGELDNPGSETFELPVEAKNIRVRASFRCRVYECEVLEIYTESGRILDSEHPMHTVEHVVEYDISNYFTVVLRGDFYTVGIEGYRINPDGSQDEDIFVSFVFDDEKRW